jgi:hypothetical protein
MFLGLLASVVLFLLWGGRPQAEAASAGVVGMLPDGQWCLVTRLPDLVEGSEVVGVRVPVGRGDVFDGPVLFKIFGEARGQCVALWEEAGDTDFLLKPGGPGGGVRGRLPFLALVGSDWHFHATDSGWRVVGDGNAEEFATRSCASQGGLQITLWRGAPLSGRPAWHRYFYLGYDLEPNCVEADFGGGAWPRPSPEPRQIERLLRN